MYIIIWTEEVIQRSNGSINTICECWMYEICYLQICSSLVWEHFQHQSKVSSNRTQCIIELFCLYNIKINKFMRVQNLHITLKLVNLTFLELNFLSEYHIKSEGPVMDSLGIVNQPFSQRPVQQSRYSLYCPKFPILQITRLWDLRVPALLNKPVINQGVVPDLVWTRSVWFGVSWSWRTLSCSPSHQWRLYPPPPLAS